MPDEVRFNAVAVGVDKNGAKRELLRLKPTNVPKFVQAAMYIQEEYHKDVVRLEIHVDTDIIISC